LWNNLVHWHIICRLNQTRKQNFEGRFDWFEDWLTNSHVHIPTIHHSTRTDSNKKLTPNMAQNFWRKWWPKQWPIWTGLSQSWTDQ
jgi:hypothetical protein